MNENEWNHVWEYFIDKNINVRKYIKKEDFFNINREEQFKPFKYESIFITKSFNYIKQLIEIITNVNYDSNIKVLIILF